MIKTDLGTYNNAHYNPGKSWLKRMLWHFTNALFLQTSWLPFSTFKIILLRLFGASIGAGVTIKPSVNIKYPWLLTIGNNCWIGEGTWIDNLVLVTLGNNCCLSQGAMLLTGNHNYTKSTFDLILGEITLEDGVWLGAKSVVCPGVTCFSHSVLTVGSVATKNLETFAIYQGNPAIKIKQRNVECQGYRL